MLRFLWRLLITGWPEKPVPPPCPNHKFETVKEVARYEYDHSDRPYGYTYIGRCDTCGEMKEWEFR